MKILLEEAMSEKKIQVTLGNYKGVEVKKAEIIGGRSKSRTGACKTVCGNDSGQRRCSGTW